MTHFRTEIPIDKLPFEISARDRILCLGSCFSEEIGGKMKRAGLDILVNPFGIIFNPMSIAQSLTRLTRNQEFTTDGLIQDQGKYHSLDHHGRFSANAADAVIQGINKEFRHATTRLKSTSLLILTLGSAWAYRHLESQKIVANCHRIPQREFEKVLIKSPEIVDALGAAIEELSTVCDDLQILLTVSPVRHWKDGPLENQVSKSHLRIACDELKSTFKNCHYFPAYELVLDELRDYRYYADDMLHPSRMAVEFIWEKFQSCSMSESLIRRNFEVEKLRKVLDHESDSPEHQQRKEKVEKQIAEILSRL